MVHRERNDMETKTGIEQLLREGNTICVMPEGYSMYPMLVPGRDSVIIEPLCVLNGERQRAGEKPVLRGDVVLYRRDAGILVLHRVFHVRKDGYYMVGDNQTRVEGPLRGDQLRGRMVGFIRRGRYCSTKDLPYRVYASLWLLVRPLRHKIAITVHFFKERIKRAKQTPDQ